MEFFIDLNFGDHEINFGSKQQSVEIQAKVIFEETFPFKELDELVSIIETTDPLTRYHILPKAFYVANRMKQKFSNSLSEDYATWLVKLENALVKLNTFSKEPPLLPTRIG